MTTLHPSQPPGHCSFGEVRFGILRQSLDERAMPFWRREAISSTVHIPGSDRSKTFLMGQGPLRVTYRLLLGDEVAYLDLCEMVQLKATLTVYAPLSRGIAGKEVWVFNEPYKQITEVLLFGLSNDLVCDDGCYEVDATFQRSSRT